MKAEIIASGTELLLGELTDTHTSFIASQLALMGIDLYFVSIVGDNYDRFLSVLKQARDRSDLVIITGGLGPTRGDITPVCSMKKWRLTLASRKISQGILPGWDWRCLKII